MPTYEYRCGDCGHEFEETQSITAKPLIKCPECGRPSLKRLVSGGGGMIFRGKGFYQTDYKNPKQKTETPPQTSTQKNTAKSPDGSTSSPPPSTKSTDSKSDPST